MAWVWIPMFGNFSFGIFEGELSLLPFRSPDFLVHFLPTSAPLRSKLAVDSGFSQLFQRFRLKTPKIQLWIYHYILCHPEAMHLCFLCSWGQRFLTGPWKLCEISFGYNRTWEKSQNSLVDPDEIGISLVHRMLTNTCQRCVEGFGPVKGTLSFTNEWIAFYLVVSTHLKNMLVKISRGIGVSSRDPQSHGSSLVEMICRISIGWILSWTSI